MGQALKPEDHARAIVALLFKEGDPVGRAFAPKALRDAWLAEKKQVRDFAAGMMWLFEHGYLAKQCEEEITLTQAGVDALAKAR